MNTNQVLMEVAKERLRQMKKWGEQNHPDGTGPDEGLSILETNYEVILHDRFTILADLFTEHTDNVFKDGEGTWADILLEEVFEAMAESDSSKLKEELIQVAAVAVAWVEAIDRKVSNS